jgi:hypothetical protein
MISIRVIALAGLLTTGTLCVGAIVPALGASPAQPAISEEASTAVAQMGKSLLSDQFSFQVRTLRVYTDTNGQPLHIAHSMKITVRRPDRVRVDVTGDDGSTKLFYDGKTAVLLGVDAKKYASVAVPSTIQGMLETLMGKLGVDFPLADLITDAPDKSFLFGVTSGREVGAAMIDGVECRHLLFTQPPGIELELWVEKNDRSLPRRLIVTYRSQRDQPSFVAEFSDWSFDIHPSDAEFAFQPPEGVVKVDLKPAAKATAKQ